MKMNTTVTDHLFLYTNHLSAKYTYNEALQTEVSNLQDEVKNFKSEISTLKYPGHSYGTSAIIKDRGQSDTKCKI